MLIKKIIQQINNIEVKFENLNKNLIQNIKIIILIFLILILSYITFYIDLFNIDLFNLKYINKLETELLELKTELKKIDIVEDKNQIEIIENDNKLNYYYFFGGLILITSVILLFYFNNNDNGGDISSNKFNLNPFEETEVKMTEDQITRRLNFLRTPSQSPERGLNRYMNSMSPIYEKGLKILEDA